MKIKSAPVRAMVRMMADRAHAVLVRRLRELAERQCTCGHSVIEHRIDGAHACTAKTWHGRCRCKGFKDAMS